MKKEDLAKFTNALTKVLNDLPKDAEEALPENGPAENIFNVSMKIAGSGNEVMFLFDNAKAPYEGKYNLIIGVRNTADNKLVGVHSVIGKTRTEILDSLKDSRFREQLAPALAQVSDKLSEINTKG